jgi:hypothetical protein
MPHDPVSKRSVSVFASAVLLCSCGSRQPRAEQVSITENTEVNTALSSFSEDIKSSVKSLAVKPAEKIFVPVTLRNTEPSTLSTTGQHPITISYKWFDHGKMLPIEGDRTNLPSPLKPGDSVDINVNVVAPETPGDLVLKITLVQEGVAWFMSAGATPLELPVTVR